MRITLPALSIIALATSAHAGVAYSFETDAQGWSIVNDGTGFTWDDTIGNNGLGAIRARDVVSGNIWLFSAPTEDLGNLSGLYNNSISYDILGITGSHTNLGGDRADIILTGAGLSIGIDAGTQPVNDQWTSASALVSVAADWRIISSFADATLTGSLATQGQIESVLADMTGLYIRGEYTNGGDATAIDNVDFVPSPGALALLGLGTLTAARRRRA
ncbi:MAG: laminin B domain-containing protein [Phycisphaerales bacterium]